MRRRVADSSRGVNIAPSTEAVPTGSRRFAVACRLRQQLNEQQHDQFGRQHTARRTDKQQLLGRRREDRL